MTCKPGMSVPFCCLALAAVSSPLFSQQSSLQTSFFAPATVHLSLSAGVADIVETEHLPYINQVAKENNKTIATFAPSPSDLLIQQAEEKFRAGRRSYRERDYTNAR